MIPEMKRITSLFVIALLGLHCIYLVSAGTGTSSASSPSVPSENEFKFEDFITTYVGMHLACLKMEPSSLGDVLPAEQLVAIDKKLQTFVSDPITKGAQTFIADTFFEIKCAHWFAKNDMTVENLQALVYTKFLTIQYHYLFYTSCDSIILAGMKEMKNEDNPNFVILAQHFACSMMILILDIFARYMPYETVLEKLKNQHGLDADEVRNAQEIFKELSEITSGDEVEKITIKNLNEIVKTTLFRGYYIPKWNPNNFNDILIAIDDIEKNKEPTDSRIAKILQAIWKFENSK